MKNPLLSFGTPPASGMTQLMGAMRSGANPISLLGSLAGIDVSKVSEQNLPQICRKLCEQRGLNFDELYNQAQQLYNQLNRK